jgi:hypothetical protein
MFMVCPEIRSAEIPMGSAGIDEPLRKALYLFAVYEGKQKCFLQNYHRPSQEDEMGNAIHRRITDKLLKAFDAA